jgi:hypothetical protein
MSRERKKAPPTTNVAARSNPRIFTLSIPVY